MTVGQQDDGRRIAFEIAFISSSASMRRIVDIGLATHFLLRDLQEKLIECVIAIPIGSPFIDHMRY